MSHLVDGFEHVEITPVEFSERGIQLLQATCPGLAPYDPTVAMDELLIPTTENFCDYVLSGIDREREQFVHLSLADNRAHGRLDNPPQLRDYDSLLTFSPLFPWTGAFEILLLPDPQRYSLKNNLHIAIPFPIPENEDATRDPGSHVNIGFGTCGEASRHIIRLFFPNYHVRDDNDNSLRNEIFAALIQAVQWEGSLTYNFPTSPEAEIFRRSGAQHSSRLVPGNVGAPIANHVVHILTSTMEWAEGCYWGVEMRGVKDLFKHQPDEAASTLRDLMQNIQRGPESATWIDVGYEVSQPSSAVLPRRDRFKKILQHVFKFSDVEATRYSSPANSGLSPDIWAAIAETAGFRLRLPPGGIGLYNAAYIQVYTTDKYITYKLTKNGNFVSFPGIQLLQMKGDDIPPYLEQLHHGLAEAGPARPIFTRYEARVPLEFALQPYMNLRSLRLDEHLYIMACQTAWQWKLLRVLGVILLSRLMAAVQEQRQRASPRALAMAVILTYFINCHLARPADTSDARQVARMILPDTRNVEDHILWRPFRRGGLTVKLQRGALWLQPCLYWGRDSAVISYIRMICSAERDLGESVYKTYLGFLPAAIELMFPLRTGLTRAQIPGFLPALRLKDSAPSLAMQSTAPLLPLSIRVNARRPMRGYDMGIDLPAEEQHGPDRHLNLEINVHAEFNDMICGFLQRVGNPLGSSGSYSRIPESSRDLTGSLALKDPKVLLYLSGAHFDPNPKLEQWSRAFDQIWPPCDGRLSKSDRQHYSKCPAFIRWENYRVDMPSDEFQRLRTAMRAQFSDLLWFPACDADRIWHYTEPKNNKQRWRRLGTAAVVPYKAPRLITNPMKIARTPLTGSTDGVCILQPEAVEVRNQRDAEDAAAHDEEIARNAVARTLERDYGHRPRHTRHEAPAMTTAAINAALVYGHLASQGRGGEFMEMDESDGPLGPEDDLFSD